MGLSGIKFINIDIITTKIGNAFAVTIILQRINSSSDVLTIMMLSPSTTNPKRRNDFSKTPNAGWIVIYLGEISLI